MQTLYEINLLSLPDFCVYLPNIRCVFAKISAVTQPAYILVLAGWALSHSPASQLAS